MSRKFFAVCALALALVLALTGCNLVKVDEAMDAATVVASFNGGTVTKGEVEPMYNYYVNYYNTLSTHYNYSISTDGLLENVTEQAVQNKVLLNKAAELGLDQLTAEEEEELREEAASNFEDTVQQFWGDYAEEGLSDEEIRADVEAYLADNDVTVDTTFDDLRDQKLLEKVRDSVYESVSVTPEEVQNRYDSKVASDEAAYADNGAFESAVSTAGTTIAWYPEGYRTVKQILVMFPEDIQSRITSLDSEISSLQSEIDSLTADIAEGAAEPAEATEETEEEPTLSNEELLAQNEQELSAKQAERETAVEAGKAAIQATVDVILERIEAGEDFQALIDEYNEDTGMQNEPTATTGYYVCADSTMWLTEFRDAAMALENVGDVSEPIVTRYGEHIIRYESDVTPGAVAFEELSDTLESEVLTAKQQEAYSAAVEGWVSDANVKYDYSCFN